MTTLNEFITTKEKNFPNATGELSQVIRDIALASKIIHAQVNKAGLVGLLGSADSSNIQGEEQQKLDVYADNVLVDILTKGGNCCALASEENDDFIPVDGDAGLKGKYVVCFDPLDGSSNIDVNVSIGTIFSVFKRKTEFEAPNLLDFLQKGTEQVAAGYVLYGSSTMLVYTTGYGVNGFTLDPNIGEFCLSHGDIKIPEGSIYSINQGNYPKFDESVQKYLDYCSKEKGYSQRYVGSMVADLHRTLLKGGLFLYPSTNSAPNGKLRLLYECNPMAMLVEQAGGVAITGKGKVMDVQPTELHQRVPIFIGSKNMVSEVESYL